MDALAVNNITAITPAQELKTSLFADFIQFIDRGERTTRTYIINLRQFIAWMHYARVTAPTRADILNYRIYLSNEHDAIEYNSCTGWSYRTRNGMHYKIKCKPNTIAQYLRSVAQFFKWTAANGYYPNIAENIHAPKVNNEQHKKEALTAIDVLNIEHSITAHNAAKTATASEMVKDTKGRIERATEQGKRLYAMYLLAVNAGLRTIEISRANIKDIEIKNGHAVLYIWGKGHTEPDRKKPIAKEVLQAINDYLESRTDKRTSNSPLFVSTGNRSKGKRIAPTTISTMLKRAMQDAGYNSERLTAHSLRHTTATNVLSITGENIHKTQKYLRHSSPTTTQIYLHETASELEQEADIAQRLYNHYHNIEACGSKKTQLDAIIEKMTPDQLEQLTSIASALQR